MSIKMQALMDQFREAKESVTFLPTPIPEYVKTHIYEPLLRGEKVLFSELDFTRFSGEDIEILGRGIERKYEMRHALTQINEIFCRAAPASTGKRTYC